MASVSLRLISSGMSSSPLRSPASTWIVTGRRRQPNFHRNRLSAPSSNLAATRAQATVELTSPTTTTACGCSSSRTGSNRLMISAVCPA